MAVAVSDRGRGYPMAPVAPRATRFGYFEAEPVDGGPCGVAVDPEIHVPSRAYKVMLDFDLAPSRVYQEPDRGSLARAVAPCPACGQAFLRRHLGMACPRCDREYHLGCWDAHGGCRLCGPAPAEPAEVRGPSAEAIQSLPSPPRYTWRERITIAFLLKVIGISTWWTATHV